MLNVAVGGEFEIWAKWDGCMVIYSNGGSA